MVIEKLYIINKKERSCVSNSQGNMIQRNGISTLLTDEIVEEKDSQPVCNNKVALDQIYP